MQVTTSQEPELHKVTAKKQFFLEAESRSAGQ
jgi:hypothetical protein